MLGGQAEFGINWLDSLLATRDQGQDIVNIAQVFARSGMTEVTWKDTGLDSIASLEGKKVGVWLGGNEHKLFAALTKNGLDPQQDVDVVAQPFDMNLFLSREVDAAAAMTYNELAQVLETENPETGELYTLDELNVLRMSEQGTGALEDGIFVREDWIADAANQDVAKRFLKASFRGWIYCRDNPDDCVDIVLENGPTLGEGHQALADERDQRPHLAERARDRRHGSRRRSISPTRSRRTTRSSRRRRRATPTAPTSRRRRSPSSRRTARTFAARTGRSPRWR